MLVSWFKELRGKCYPIFDWGQFTVYYFLTIRAKCKCDRHSRHFCQWEIGINIIVLISHSENIFFINGMILPITLIRK